MENEKSSLQMRRWVWKALQAVIQDQAYSNLYLKQHLQELEPSQQKLATQIFYGTLQNYRLCEYLWKQFAKKRVKPSIAILLSMSVYQLLKLDGTKDYAVVHEAVELAKSKSKAFGGFVNAILRKVIALLQSEEDYLPQDPLERIALQASLPQWLITMWARQYGEQKAGQYALSSLQTHPVTIRYNPLKGEKSGLDHHEGNIANDPDYRNGLYSVQDAGSYAIAEFLKAEPGETILDLCAAPGTKTLAVAEMMNDQGRIDALDLYESRTRLIEKDQKRLGLTIVNPMARDATEIEDLGLYDRILCDVPCSGYGVLARKPDMKLHLDQRQSKTLTDLQQQLLQSASAHLKPNGTLVYSTCTLNKKENEMQIQSFLDLHDDFYLDEMQTIEPGNENDGFFMARLIKK